MKKVYILSFSGGKDSTAMLLLILKKKLPLDFVVFCDTGAEFPEVYKHIEKINKEIYPVTVIKPKMSFFDYLTVYKRKKGMYKGKPYSFPSRYNRWCTRALKINPLQKFKRQFKNCIVIDYIGYSTDELVRAKKLKKKETDNQKYLFPLIINNINSQNALAMCYKAGFTWNGLYQHVSRASCFCCPFTNRKGIKYLIFKRPELWEKIKLMENLLKQQGHPQWKFSMQYSTEEWEKIFLVNRKKLFKGGFYG